MAIMMFDIPRNCVTFAHKTLRMSRKRKPNPILEGITIEAVAAEGKNLFHHDERVVFVPFCVPGDVVDVEIVRKKHRYAEGRVIRFIEKSKVREEPFCKHFGICGGCKWQNLPYAEQLKAKQQQVFDQLSRIGKVSLPDFLPILGSVKTKEYRNKLEFGCCNRRWFTHEELQDKSLDLTADHSAIGFHITGAFDKIYPIEQCYLMDNLHNEIRNFTEQSAKDIGMSFYDVKAQHGVLRNLMFRNSNTGEWMLLIQFHFEQPEDEEKALELMQRISNKFHQISSLMYVDNQKGNDTIGDLELKTFKGTSFIYETMESLRFKVGPKSFYQTNTDQAYHLYSVARAFSLCNIDHAGKLLLPDETALQTAEQLSSCEKPLIYDLYTGTGTIANFMARYASRVVGIEYVPEAIEDAKTNSKLNGIDNTTFFAGDMKDILNDDFIRRHGTPAILITDPPRAGMHPDVVNVILNASPERIVYVSCNPATQARDLALLDAEYAVMAVQPVDMFPHTPHVENVVLLKKRDKNNI